MSNFDGDTDLTNIRAIKSIIYDHEYRVSKALGQNFLVNASVLQSMVNTARPRDEAIIEIGAGMGVLTRELSIEAREIISVEISERLLPILRRTLANRQNIRLVMKDFLKCSPSDFQPASGDIPVIAGNLPYSIATPAIFRFIDGEIPWKRMALMIQLDVAERMCAEPGSKRYGALTIGVRSAAEVTLIRKVPPSAFWPRPKVTSAIIEITPIKADLNLSRPFLRRLLASAFSSRRKTMKNALRTFPNAMEAINECNIDPQCRPEQVSIPLWMELSRQLLETVALE